MKTILSVDGGGMKGYIPCSVLIALEAKAGKPCGEIFDMFAGTSIGGIIVCLLALGRSALDSLKFFSEDGPKIFGHQQFLGYSGILRPRYSAQPLEECLRDRLKIVPPSGLAWEPSLSSVKKALLVTAFDLTAYEPVFFKTPNPDTDYMLWQVCRATSAAQTYFPAFRLDNMVLWDGGNVVNNPSVCAVAEAMRLWPDEPLRVLSLSCGPAKSKLPPPWLVNAGILRVALETLGLLFDANDELPDYILKHIMGEGYFRVTPARTHNLSIDGCSGKALSDLYDAAHACVQTANGTLDAFLNFK